MQIKAFGEHYNHQRHHDSLKNLTQPMSNSAEEKPSCSNANASSARISSNDACCTSANLLTSANRWVRTSVRKPQLLSQSIGRQSAGPAQTFHCRGTCRGVLPRFPEPLAAGRQREHQWRSGAVSTKWIGSVRARRGESRRDCPAAEHAAEENPWLQTPGATLAQAVARKG
jgi:hypothetical protein